MKRVLMYLGLAVACFLISFTPVYAQENSEDAQSFSGQVMTLSEDSLAYPEPDETSGEARAFTKGESVFVVEESDGWYKIFFKGENLYIPKEGISEEAAMEAEKQSEELAAEVQEEMKEVSKQYEADLETYERQNVSQRNSMIWKIVIGVLVVVIIIISVIIGVKNMKSEEDDK